MLARCGFLPIIFWSGILGDRMGTLEVREIRKREDPLKDTPLTLRIILLAFTYKGKTLTVFFFFCWWCLFFHLWDAAVRNIDLTSHINRTPMITFILTLFSLLNFFYLLSLNLLQEGVKIELLSETVQAFLSLCVCVRETWTKSGSSWLCEQRALFV